MHLKQHICAKMNTNQESSLENIEVRAGFWIWRCRRVAVVDMLFELGSTIAAICAAGACK